MVFLPCFSLQKKPFFSELPVPFGSFKIRRFQFLSDLCPAHLTDVTLDCFVDETAAIPFLGYAVYQLHCLFGERYIDATIHGRTFLLSSILPGYTLWVCIKIFFGLWARPNLRR